MLGIKNIVNIILNEEILTNSKLYKTSIIIELMNIY